MSSNMSPKELRELIREEFNNAMNAPIASLQANDYVGYHQVVGVNTVMPEAVVTVSTTDNTADPLGYPPGSRFTGSVGSPVFVYPPNDTNTFRAVEYPGAFRITPQEEPNHLSADQLRELLGITYPNRNPVVSETTQEDLTEMIHGFGIVNGVLRITVNGPQMKEIPDDPELIKRLDREIKAAVIRAFNLVVDIKKLQEHKRTLIVD